MPFVLTCLSSPNEAFIIVSGIYKEKDVGYIHFTRSRSFWAARNSAHSSPVWTSFCVRPTPNMIWTVTTIIIKYNDATTKLHIQSGVTRSLLNRSLSFFGCEPSKDLFHKRQVNAISIYASCPALQVEVQSATAKVQLFWQITSIYCPKVPLPSCFLTPFYCLMRFWSLFLYIINRYSVNRYQGATVFCQMKPSFFRNHVYF